MESNAVTAGILAGGKSRRMGQNKALLPWDSRTLLEKTVSLFSDFSTVLISAAGDEGYMLPGCRTVADVRPDYGPLEGLYRLLLAAETDWCFVAAVDMPLLNRAFIERLLSEVDADVLAILPFADNRLHPLCGLYHRSILPVLEALFLEQRHSMQSLLERIAVRQIDIASTGLSLEILSNANTPEELEACLIQFQNKP